MLVWRLRISRLRRAERYLALSRATREPSYFVCSQLSVRRTSSLHTRPHWYTNDSFWTYCSRWMACEGAGTHTLGVGAIVQSKPCRAYEHVSRDRQEHAFNPYRLAERDQPTGLSSSAKSNSRAS